MMLLNVKRESAVCFRRYRRVKDTGMCALRDELIEVLHKEGRLRTARAYGSAVRSFLSYVGRDEFPMSCLCPEVLKGYEEYLLGKGRSLNTVSFYMRNLRAIYYKGIALGWVKFVGEDLFGSVYTGVSQTSKRAAGKNDIRKLHRWVEEGSRDTSRDAEALRLSGYYFLFCFYARGMSYVDMAYLKKRDVQGDLIRYRRQKTGQVLEVKITAELRHILSLFSESVRDSVYLFPVIRDREKSRRQYESGLRLQNRRLKELGRRAGVSVPLSTHVARHSWATIARHAHVPLAVISEGLGHRSEKTTSIYLASFDGGVLDRANRRVASCIKKCC